MLKKLDIGTSEIEQVEAFNALVDVVNELQLAKDVMFNRIDMLNNAICDIRNRITTLDDPTYHEAEAAPADNSEKANCQENVQDELERTRKALDVAVDALKVYANRENWDFEHFYSLETYDIAGEALEQITALEQKDK